MKKILIINGHPDKQSFCNAIAMQYKTGAENAGNKVVLINLYELQFDPVLRYGYREKSQLEPDLVKAQNEILNADHLVFVYPNWWATYPALLKGFIDRVFLPGFAFKYREKGMLWDKLLTGKSAHVFVTMDTPKFFYKLFMHQPGHNSFKKGILNFCGIKPVKIFSFHMVRKSGESKRKEWLQKVNKIASEI